MPWPTCVPPAVCFNGLTVFPLFSPCLRGSGRYSVPLTFQWYESCQERGQLEFLPLYMLSLTNGKVIQTHLCWDVARADPAKTWKNCSGYLQEVNFQPKLFASTFIFGKTIASLCSCPSISCRRGWGRWSHPSRSMPCSCPVFAFLWWPPSLSHTEGCGALGELIKSC